MRTWARYLVYYAAGVIIIALIFSRLDLGKFLSVVHGGVVSYLLFALLTVFVMYVVRSVRWRYLIERTGTKCRMRAAITGSLIAITLGFVTPSKLGEFWRIRHATSLGVSMKSAIASAVLDRGSDIVVIGVLGVIALVRYAEVLELTFQRLWLIAVFGLVLLLVMWKFQSVMKRWAQHLCTRDKLRKYLVLVLLSMIGWSLYFYATLLLSRGVGIEMPALDLVGAVILANLVALLPISIGGLGTREAVFIGVLLPWGIVPEQATALGILIFSMNALSCIPGGILWFFQRRA